MNPKNKLSAISRKVFVLCASVCVAIFLILFICQPNFLEATGFFTEIQSNGKVAPLPPVSSGVNLPMSSNCYQGFCENTSPTCPVSLIYTRNIDIGDYGIDVVALQDFLISNDYLVMPKGSVKGYFGQKTSDALSDYQTENNLVDSGLLDVVTLNKLNGNAMAGAACYLYVRYDALNLTFKKGINISRTIGQLSNAGFTALDGTPLCSKNKNSDSCYNIFNKKSFILKLPDSVSVAKTANYLASIGLFDKILFVPASLSDIQDMPELLVRPISSTKTTVVYATTTATSTNTKDSDYATASTTVTYTSYTLPQTVLGSSPTQKVVNQAVLNTKTAPDPFLYGTWKLTRYRNVDLTLPFGQSDILVSIAQDSTVGISACNRATSTAKIYGNVIATNYFPTPTSYCSPMKDGLERELRDTFNSTASYEIAGSTYRNSTMSVTSASTGAKYEFVRVN